jgi:hypothetical protein
LYNKIFNNKNKFRDGLKDFWDILKVIMKEKEYCDPENKIFYITDVYSAYSVFKNLLLLFLV